jgi:hypothetical protein
VTQGFGTSPDVGWLDQALFNQKEIKMAMNSVERMGQAIPHASEPSRHSEGTVARTIEEQTAQLPSDVFLWAAGASIVGAMTMKMMGKHQDALFVGQWAAPFLLLGVYNKIVKVAGSDRLSA